MIGNLWRSVDDYFSGLLLDPDPVLDAALEANTAGALPPIDASLNRVPDADLSPMQCLLIGSAPISPSRLGEALEKIGPFIGQLFGQSEAPMMSMMSPADYFNEDGSIATHRLTRGQAVSIRHSRDHGRRLEPDGPR